MKAIAYTRQDEKSPGPAATPSSKGSTFGKLFTPKKTEGKLQNENFNGTNRDGNVRRSREGGQRQVPEFVVRPSGHGF